MLGISAEEFERIVVDMLEKTRAIEAGTILEQMIIVMDEVLKIKSYDGENLFRLTTFVRFIQEISKASVVPASIVSG